MVHSTWLDFWARVAIVVPAFLVAVSFHEFSHALVASWLGDDTAKKRGRLTLNPVAHIDLLGLLFLIIFKIGWATPVPIDHRNFKFPRLYSIVAALAGPFSNFVLAFACFVCIKYLPIALLSPSVVKTFMQILSATAWVNVMLGVFNLLPIPPLDGSHIITALLSKPFPRLVMWLYRYSLLFILILFMFPSFQQALLELIIKTEQFIKHLVF